MVSIPLASETPEIEVALMLQFFAGLPGGSSGPNAEGSGKAWFSAVLCVLAGAGSLGWLWWRAMGSMAGE